MAAQIGETVEGDDVSGFVEDLRRQVYDHLRIQVHTGSEIGSYSGYVGNFKTQIRPLKQGAVKGIEHGVTIVATGAEESIPSEYLYGQSDRVKTLLELDEMMGEEPGRFGEIGSVVFIQCVGSRNEDRPYCSRVCCTHTVKDALKLKELNPGMEITVLYRDMRTYGLKEDYYKKASDQEVVFIRYDVDDVPEVEAMGEGRDAPLKVRVTEPILGHGLELNADLLCLASAAVSPPANQGLSRLLKVPQNEDGFFMEAHMKLRPVDFATEGIFMCGSAHSPKFIEESLAQAQAAASRAVTILAQEEMRAGGSVCEVNALMCTGCGVCEEVCPFRAVEVDAETGVAQVTAALCKGCGACASSCRSGALDVAGFNDEQTLLLVKSLSAS